MTKRGFLSHAYLAWTLAILASLVVITIGQHSAPTSALAQEVDIDDPTQREFPAGAGLKTDPELERLLKRAAFFVADGRYDLAGILWQRVLDESGETVMTRPDWEFKTFDRKYRKYKSVADEIERTISRLPAAGLRVYRLSADGEAQAILAAGQGPEREEALAKVVRRYFLCSLGDDAAFELACMKLDRHDFVGAGRLLQKILSDYPDPSVLRGEILLRLAIANARIGDHDAAATVLADLERTADSAVLARRLPLVKGEIARSVGETRGADLAASDWPMAYGEPSRHGHMQPLPSDATAAKLSEAWVAGFGIDPASISTVNRAPAQLEGGFFWTSNAARYPQQNLGASLEQTLSNWKTHGWMPAGQLLLKDGLVFYKKQDRIVCRDARTGEMKWMGRESAYQGTQLVQWARQMRRNRGQNTSGNNIPASLMEAMLFSDRLQQAMVISEGMLYSIDPPVTDVPGAAPQAAQSRFDYRSVPRRARTNVLVAYSADNGKFKWMRSADGGVSGSKFHVGFMAAPVPYARFLLVPVNDNGSLWLHALDKNTGERVWKTFLCEDPISGASPWSPVGVSVGGGDAYVATGGGVVFAVDAMSGTVRWAVRYQRSAQPNNQNVRSGYARYQAIEGWEEDLAIPHGKQLVVLPSDSDKIFALDRRTGQLLWDSPRTPASEDDPGQYCLGILGDGLIVAGKQSVRCYDLAKDGKIAWDTKLQQSFGHGVLTANAIYMPVGEEIVRVDPSTGKIAAQVAVFSPTREPTGNLYSDGQQLLSVGLARVYALQDLKHRLDELAARIDSGDSMAQLERMRLRIRGEEFDEALSDLRAAYARMLEKEGSVAARTALYLGMTELKLTNRQPELALELLATAERAAGSAEDQPEEILQLRENVLRAGLQQVNELERTGAAQVLGVTAFCQQSGLLSLARQALVATTRPEDAELIVAALSDENENVRVTAMAALPKALGKEKATEKLLPLLADEGEHVRLAAAIALANEGERKALPTLGELLDAEDLQVRARSVQALRALTGQRFKFVAYDKPEDRVAAASGWKKWIGDNAQTVELKFPIADSKVMLGRTLVCFYSRNKVIELDADRKQVWELNVNQPWGCDGLPNGHRLICSYNGKFVAEYNEAGKEIWKMDNLPGYCSNAHRLENGNTLLTCSNANKIIEVTHDKKTVWSVDITSNPQDARRLENGNTLIALQGTHKVVEVDRSGKVVWEVGNMRGPFSARRLDNGNTLIAQSGGGQVVEIDRNGKEVWKKTGLSTPYDAQRLDNGNTLITDNRGYREVDPDGKILWETKQSGSLRINRY